MKNKKETLELETIKKLWNEHSITLRPNVVYTSPKVYYLEGIKAFIEELYKLGVEVKIKSIKNIK